MAMYKEVEDTVEVFEIKSMMKRARAAQEVLAGYTQEQVDQLIKAMVWSVARAGVAEKIAERAVEETQLGDYAGKYGKIYGKIRAALFRRMKTSSVRS